jgi:trans-aconitate methyltransferase
MGVSCVNQSWNPQLYDHHHAFVTEYGKALLDLLAPKHGETILDLGCGTGDLTYQISQRGANVIGVDNSEAMIASAREKYPDITFILADARHLNLDFKCDAVFSNAVLHWIKQPIDVLQSVWNILLPHGRFVAEFGGKGNVHLIQQEIEHVLAQAGYQTASPWYFPSIGEYASVMEQVGFRVVYATHFDRLTKLEDGINGLKHWIEMFAGSYFQQVPSSVAEELIRQIENNLKKKLFVNGDWHADYKRIRVIGIKEE